MHLLIIMGPPAAGKSSIIRELVPHLPPQTIHIQTDSIRFLIPSPSYSHKESVFVYDAAHRLAEQALYAGYTAILDATFVQAEELQRALDLGTRLDVSTHVIHITAPLEETLSRNRQREGAARIDESALKRIWAGLEGVHVPGEIRIDTSIMTPSQAVVRIRTQLGL